MVTASTHPLISVIIPVYNVRPYLARCFHSLADQSHKNLEVIFVDDCSTDGSYEECLRLCATDSRFQVLKQAKNGGAGNARQRGIETSTGEFIGFVDGDDYVESDMYKELLSIITQTKADIACSNAYYVFENKPKKTFFKCSAETERLTVPEAQLRMHLRKGISYSFCDKLFQRHLFTSVTLQTQPFEDQAQLPLLFKNAQAIGVRLTPLYNYVQREGSTMYNRYNPGKEMIALELFHRSTYMLQKEYGITEVKTVIRMCLRFINNLCLLPRTAGNIALHQKAVALLHQYRHYKRKHISSGRALKRYLILNHEPLYRYFYRTYIRLFAPAKYRRINNYAHS